MKHTFIFGTIISVLALASHLNAQSLSLSVVPSGDKETIAVNFPAPSGRNFVIFEAVLPAATAAECMASRDFSNAVQVGADRASVAFDPITSTYFLKAIYPVDSKQSCHVLIARSSVDTSDLNIWRSNFGSVSGFSEAESEKTESSEARAQRSMVRSLTVTFDQPGS